MATNNSQFLYCCTRMDRRGQSKDAFSLAFCLTVAKSIYKSQKKNLMPEMEEQPRNLGR